MFTTASVLAFLAIIPNTLVDLIRKYSVNIFFATLLVTAYLSIGAGRIIRILFYYWILFMHPIYNMFLTVQNSKYLLAFITVIISLKIIRLIFNVTLGSTDYVEDMRTQEEKDSRYASEYERKYDIREKIYERRKAERVGKKRKTQRSAARGSTWQPPL